MFEGYEEDVLSRTGFSRKSDEIVLCCSTLVVVLAILLNLGGHRFKSGDFAFNALLVGKVFVFFHVNIWDFNIHVWFFIIIIIINTLPF